MCGLILVWILCFISSMLLLFSSGYLVKQDKALYVGYSIAALGSIYREFLSTTKVPVVKIVVNLAALSVSIESVNCYFSKVCSC